MPVSLIDRLLPKKLPEHFSAHPVVSGRLTRVVGLTLEAVGLNVAVGDGCLVEAADGSQIQTEVIGFDGDKIYLMPFVRCERLRVGATVVPAEHIHCIGVGESLLGRVLDGLGRPLDHLPPPVSLNWVSLKGEAINPLQRRPIQKVLDVGIRAINGLLTVGRGQRIGLFAGSGIGKSVLLGMMTRFTEADIVVVGLVGERGREVREFIEHSLGKEGLKKSVVVASPADDVPLLRLRASFMATRIAEYYRDQGKNVLLLMDSLTRFAQAQRELALASGEAPATRGYPPSVFAKLPQLVERAGNGADGGGSLTAIYTVLAEGDDLQDPVVDSARAILDGHIVLSRELAENGIYPAIDIEASVSRVMPSVVEPAAMQRAVQCKKLYSSYRKHQDLITIGAYQSGSNAEIDRAIEKYPRVQDFISQSMQQKVTFTQAQETLRELLIENVASPLPPVQRGKPLAMPKANALPTQRH